jgi:hypothetical protein
MRLRDPWARQSMLTYLCAWSIVACRMQAIGARGCRFQAQMGHQQRQSQNDPPSPLWWYCWKNHHGTDHACRGGLRAFAELCDLVRYSLVTMRAASLSVQGIRPSLPRHRRASDFALRYHRTFAAVCNPITKATWRKCMHIEKMSARLCWEEK